MEIPRNKTGLNNLWLFGLGILVVLGSFLLSFQIGKMIFIPVKELPAPAPSTLAGAAPAGEEAPEIQVETTPLAVPLSDETSAGPAVSRPAGQTTVPATAPAQTNIVSKPKPASPKPANQPAVVTSYSQSASNKVYKVQVGPYATRDRADEIAKELVATDLPAFVTASGTLWKVQVGAFKSADLAADLVTKLKKDGYPATLVAQ